MKLKPIEVKTLLKLVSWKLNEITPKDDETLLVKLREKMERAYKRNKLIEISKTAKGVIKAAIKMAREQDIKANSGKKVYDDGDVYF
jgi:hypothetical protein